MSKSKHQHPLDFGRVFFPDKTNPVPDVVYFQPLGNHVANVRKLIKSWKTNYFSGANIEEKQKSKKRVDEGARVHDRGKPNKFKIEGKIIKEGKFKEYIYSFKGHRFEAVSSDEWAQCLAVGHHDFSVGDICRDAYKLRKQSTDYADILAEDILAYAQELYILEMCDQIEAELACRVIGNDEQADSRAFMDYTTAKLNDFNYLIDPYPFEDSSISLSFAYWSMKVSQSDKDELQKYFDKNEHYKLGTLLDKIARNWWQSQQGKPEKSEPKSITLIYYKSDDNLKNWNYNSIYKVLGGENFVPNPMQREVFKAIANNDHPAVMLKSPTGSGKMEAILFPALARGYRLFLPLPARSLLEDQKERIEKYLKKFSKLQPEREISLVVDTGAQMYRWVYRNGEDITSTLNINSRRHLYKGDVILTTLDKFLYRYFAFGDKQKSFIFPLRIHREKTLICFDEAHTYDEISFTNFQSLVKSLYEAGRSLVLMTATMPIEHYERFNYLSLIDFVDNYDYLEELNQFQQQTLKQPHLNKKAFEWHSHLKRDQDNPEVFQNEIAKIILKEWQLKANRRIIAVVETVKDTAAIYQYLIKNFGSNTDVLGQFIFLYHGRIADQIRPIIYKQIQERDANSQPYILVTTSAIEVGCDLNAEVLISQICPPENLIQRAGRCNRKGNISDAKVILVGDEIPDFANTLDDFGWQKYQKNLQSLEDFDAQIIAKCISITQQIDDYRVVELFSMLHDYVYGADLTSQPAHEKGLVITRSWKPSSTLIYLYKDENGNQQKHKVTVPIDRLIKNQNNQYANTYVYEHYYNYENTQWESRDLGWGSAYSKDIFIEISANNQGAGTFDCKDEYPYNPEFGFVELPGVFIKLKTSDFEEKLLYQHNDKKSSIITYTKSLNTD
ncbi:CRISPR-associated helicase Cas3' [uncultured Nostoc sp.]|uniref:CRISPR-associated helicase Cas3' n=1 Tax=uncultured Nostoc sp. TaxID=340711 RepID=UPI0035CB11B0